MESNSTMTKSAAAMAGAHTRVWRDRLQPGTRLLADIVIPVQGTTLPTAGQAGLIGQAAAQWTGAVPAFATYHNSMDVPPFRNGRPPV